MFNVETSFLLNRPQYQTLKKCLREGDLLYIKSIDRFGRNSKEIKNEYEETL